MKRSVSLVIFFAFGFLMTMAQDYSRYVDPRIGSEGLGRTFPGPCMPYGMAKPGPDAVSMPNAGWAPMPEPVIQPFLDAGEIIQKRVDEKIALGYYACTFENGIRTEITASERCAFYRFDYGRKQKGKLLIDVATFLGIDTIPDKRETQQYVDSYVTCDGKYAVSGWSTVRGGWNNGGPYTVYFYLQSDVPLSNSDVPLANGEAPLYNKYRQSEDWYFAYQYCPGKEEYPCLRLRWPVEECAENLERKVGKDRNLRHRKAEADVLYSPLSYDADACG